MYAVGIQTDTKDAARARPGIVVGDGDRVVGQDFALQRGVGLRGVVRKSDGSRAGHVGLSVAGPENPEGVLPISFLSGEDGSYEVALLPGPHLSRFGPWGRGEEREVFIRAGTAPRLDLRMS